MSTAANAAPRVNKAYDTKSSVVLVLSDGRKAQFSFDAASGELPGDTPAISADGRVVAWVRVWKPISSVVPAGLGPLEVWRNDKLSEIQTAGPFIWDWAFEGTGKIVTMSGPAHFAWPGVFELFDATSGKRLAEWDDPDDARGPPPPWAAPIFPPDR